MNTVGDAADLRMGQRHEHAAGEVGPLDINVVVTQIITCST
ncbi:hypothetical protein [Paraburkholderia sp. PGU19]|nr:hypothetical protein [Paraburkholderia sp. PGU19]